MTESISFASALSTDNDPEKAVSDICEAIVRAAGEASPEFVVVFFSADLNPHAEKIQQNFNKRLQPRFLIGCCGESIVGTARSEAGQYQAREVENATAITALACFRGDEIEDDGLLAMQLRYERSNDGGAIVGWPDGFDSRLSTDSRLIVLADPFSFPTEIFLERMNEDWPGLTISGGVASGCPEPGDTRLLLTSRSQDQTSNQQVLDSGAIVLHLPASTTSRTVVSQGCRPIGEPMVITKCEANEIQELGGRPALLQLKEMFDKLPARDQQQVQSALHVGRVVDEYQDEFEQGDFLIRNVMGVDPATGFIAVGDYFRPGQTVQFQIRDEESADGEMSSLLSSDSSRSSSAATDSSGAASVSSSAALLFSCNGRGTRMFSEPDHDAALIARKLGDIPMAGFFAAGEIGPVLGKNHLHGFTASMVLFG